MPFVEGDRLTGTGFAVGTPAYMSPEQAFGMAVVAAWWLASLAVEGIVPAVN